MKRINNGTSVLIIVISVAIVFVSIIGLTFAYFTVNVEVIGSKKNTLIESKTLIVEYSKTNNIYYRNLIPGRPEENDEDEYTNKLTFKMTSPTNMLVKTVYDVYLNIEENNFVTNNLVFYLNENECFRTDGTGSASGELQSEEFENYEMDGEMVVLGVIPSEKTGRYKISENAVLGGLGCQDTWTIELWLKETGIEQNEDQSRKFKASIEIETKEILPIEGFTKEDVDDYIEKLEEEKKKEELENEENVDNEENNNEEDSSLVEGIE